MANRDQDWAESNFEITSKRRKGFPFETQVKRGVQIVHGNTKRSTLDSILAWTEAGSLKKSASKSRE